MNIKQLQYFIAIAEEKQITAAAQRLHMAQPPLSQQLKSLEEELGLVLFEREGRSLRLTEAGKRLYDRALTLVQMMDETTEEMKNIASGISGKLSIGVNTLSDISLSPYLQEFRRLYPKVTHKIFQNDSAQLSRLLKERTIELAFVRLPLDIQHYEILPIRDEEFVFVTPKSLVLRYNFIHIREIEKYPLILPSTEGLGIYNMLLQEFSRLKLSPKVHCECSDIKLLLDLIISGFGVTLLPLSILNHYHGAEVNYYKLEGTKLSSTSAIIWLKQMGLSAISKKFIELVKDFGNRE